MNKALLAVGLLFLLFSTNFVLAAGSISLKEINQTGIPTDGLLSLSNNGTLNLTNVVLRSVGIPQLSFSNNHFDLPVPPNGGGYAIASRPHVIDPWSLYFGPNAVNITATSNENISASINSSIIRSFCNNGSVGGKLTVRSVKIKNAGNDSIWRFGDTIEIQVTVKNNENYDFSDVRVKLGFFDSQGVNKVSSLDFLNLDAELISIGNLASGNDHSVSFPFIVPTNFKPGDYRLALKVYDTVIRENNQCQDTTKDFDHSYYQSIHVPNEDGDIIHLNSCSVLDQANQKYRLEKDLFWSESNRPCYEFAAPHISLDLNSHVLYGNYNSIALSSKDFNSFSVSNGTIASFGKGIYLENSSWNVVTGITFSHNNNGVIVNGTSQFNKIYNNIFNNVHNVVVFNGFYKNFFSVPIYWGKNILGGHFIGGNYWANHDGTGFSETCIDQDKNGLCDNGYPLAFGSIDSSPLSRAQLQKV